MKIYKTLFLLIFIGTSINAFGQLVGSNDNYQFLLSVDSEIRRKMTANEVMFDEKEKYLIVNYGNRPTYIVVYEFGLWKAVANFRLTNWVEFSGAYVDHETNQLYIKEGRFSNEYYRLDINNGTTDVVECTLTPGGCPVVEPKQSDKAIYSNDKNYYVTVNKRNTRDVRVYQLKSSSD